MTSTQTQYQPGDRITFDEICHACAAPSVKEGTVVDMGTDPYEPERGRQYVVEVPRVDQTPDVVLVPPGVVRGLSTVAEKTP
jgi:hypothetical protein